MKYLDNKVRLNKGFKVIMFLVILALNFLFLAYWSYQMYKDTEKKIRKKFKRAYTLVCLKNNKERMEEILKQQEKHEENEYLKEKFDLAI